MVPLTREHGTDYQLIYEDADANCIYIPLSSISRDEFIARSLAMLGTDGDEAMFYGAQLWITLFSIGSPQLEKTGWMQIELMRHGFGELRSLEAASGHWFRNGEVVELAAFLGVCIQFRWDAWLVPASSNQIFVHISHDEYAVIVTRDAETYERCMKDLKHLKPQSGGRLIAQFCPNSRHIVSLTAD